MTDDEPPTGCIGAPDYAGTRATYLHDILDERDEWMTAPELADATGIPTTTVRAALGELAERGVVDRRPRIQPRQVGRTPDEYRAEAER